MNNLIGSAITLATNTITEYAVSKVVITLLDSVVPGKFSKFARFAIKFGTSVIYEATIGEKVSSYMMENYKAGVAIRKAFDEDTVDSKENESEPEEVGA